MQMVWKGAVTSPGKALGKVVRIRKISPVNLDEKSSLNREMTLAKVDKAMKETAGDLQKLSKRFLKEGKKVKAEILEIQDFMLNDKIFNQAVRQEIEAGYSAEAAVERGILAQCALLEKTGNSFLNERIDDIHDIGDRIVCRIR